MENQLQAAVYSLLGIDSLRLSFVRGEVTNVDLMTSVDRDMAQGGDVGSLLVKGCSWRVFALSGDFELLPVLPRERRFCVCFGDGYRAGSFALACDLVRSVDLDAETHFQSLPECMQHPLSPIRKLRVERDELIYLSDTASLRSYLETLTG